MAVSPEPPEAFERGRLFAGIPLELLHKALEIFGPEFHAIASARDGGVVILAIDEARSDRGKDIDSVIGLRLRRINRLGIAMVPSPLKGEIDILRLGAQIGRATCRGRVEKDGEI